MPSSLQKARKQISKKRGGEVNALHERSRDSVRLHKASARDLRLEKLASSRNKKEQPICKYSSCERDFDYGFQLTGYHPADRVAFFQGGLQEKGNVVLDVAGVQSLVSEFVHQYDEEFNDAKKARRPGRPASVKEDLLKMKIKALESEYKDGFLLPDIMSEEGVKKLELWEGSWSYLTTLTWIKVSIAGKVNPGDFPSKGLN
ncbi:hypothetical protein Golomagni_06102 [Golovinomyces magnicellulatus]|nr:hypothetical protein Golomagni_06102 [Golovinomyces magnicellulatus]